MSSGGNSGWRWIVACIDGLGLVVAQREDSEDWNPEQEQGSTRLRRLTLLKATTDKFGLEKLHVAATFGQGEISVRPWAIFWLAAPVPEVVAKANELWSDLSVATPDQVPDFGGPRRRRR